LAGIDPSTRFQLKLVDFSVVYRSYVLNWIDFRMEIGHHVRLIGGTTATKAKYLISHNILGSGLD